MAGGGGWWCGGGGGGLNRRAGRAAWGRGRPGVESGSDPPSASMPGTTARAREAVARADRPGSAGP